VPTLQLSGVSDVLQAGLAELGEGKWTDLTTDLQEFVAVPNLLKKNRVVIQSGHSIQWDLITDHNNSARAVGLFASDRVDVPNGLTQGSMPWRHTIADYAFDHHEVTANEGARQIVSLIKARRHMAMVSMAEYMERRFWRVPDTTDEVNPHGVPYWIVKNATEGFNGGAPSGYTTVAGLNPSTLSRWKNYTAPYTAVTYEDLIAKWWKAATYTKFKAPVQSPTFNTGDQYGYYTTYTVYAGLKNLLMAQNEDLGSDLDSQDGNPTFRRVPVTWVPVLDEDTTNPVYGINWGEFKTAILGNWWMKETVLDRVPGQHNVSAVYIDSSFNWICRNRRRNFVLSNGTTLPN
jgi:hypothetical protein